MATTEETFSRFKEILIGQPLETAPHPTKPIN
jgi:hypothetical protein